MNNEILFKPRLLVICTHGFGLYFFSCGVYNSKRICLVITFSQVSDFDNHNKSLTAKLLMQGYRNHKLFFIAVILN